MPQTHRPLTLRYGLCLLAIAVATAVRMALSHAVGHHLLVAPFLLAALFSAWYGGFGPALVAVVAGLAEALFVFMPHDGAFAAHGPAYPIKIGFFATVGLTSAAIIESLHAAHRRARTTASQAIDRQRELEREIAQRQQAQEALRRQREWWRVTLASVADAVIVTDPEARVVFMNPAAQALTGWHHDDAVGQPLDDVFRIIHEQTRAPVESPARQVLRLGTTADLTRHTLLLARDGSERSVENRAAPILDAHGQMLGVIQVFRDITERQRMEEEIRRQAEVLKATDRRKDEFLALLAHELRNPLAPVLTAVHMMKKRGTEDPQLHWARDVVERQVQQMTRLVDDLLDVSRISRGKIRLRKEVVGLATIMRRAVETSGPLIAERKHELTVSLPSEAVQVEADPTRLVQVLVNLLNNAAKYTEPGGRIWLAVESHPDGVVLRVKDTGIGMRADMLSVVFDPFVQSERAVSHAPGGLGLGLALARRLVEMHGGSITAHSAGPNQGSEFVVRLPVLPAAPEPKPAAAHDKADQARTPPASRRVLLVDDNVDSAEGLALCLKLDGHEVFVASDGPSALDVVSDFRPDVVISDIGMPGMDGYELARRIKALPGMERVLLMALTGWGQQRDRRRSREAGFGLHLVKPVEPSTLRKLLAHPDGRCGLASGPADRLRATGLSGAASAP